MMRRLLIVSLLISQLIIVLPSSAQDAPAYIQFCDPTDPNLETLLTSGSDRVTAVATSFANFQTGNLTALEGIAAGEQELLAWQNVASIDCLAPFDRDVTTLLSNFLIVMLYAQNEVNPEIQEAFVVGTEQLIGNLQTGVEESLTYIQNFDPSAETTPEEETTEPTTIRTTEELTSLLAADLQANGITVLREASFQAVPDNMLVQIALDRVEGFDDFTNTAFTFDVLAGIIGEWPELPEITRIIVETYAGDERTLYVESSGDNFRSYYYDGTLSQEDFNNALTRQ